MSELFAIGTSALIANQRMLSTASHNIANAETNGFKKSAASFADVVAAMFSKFSALQAAAPDTKWRDVNLAASADWPRLASAQSWVEAHAKASDPSLDAFRTSARTVASTTGGLAPADADKLYRSLIEWRASTP